MVRLVGGWGGVCSGKRWRTFMYLSEFYESSWICADVLLYFYYYYRLWCTSTNINALCFSREFDKFDKLVGIPVTTKAFTAYHATIDQSVRGGC